MVPVNPVRNDRIDTLRGVAIACVLLLHYALAYGWRPSPLDALFTPGALRAVVLNGNYGVTMFFAVSGFLITGHSLRRWGSLAHIDLRTFYGLRLSRIMPSLVLALGIVVALGCLGLPYFANTDNGQHLPASFFLVAAGSILTFWHNVLMQHVGYFNYCLNVYWSLSVEEVFYLCMPLICVGLKRTEWLVLVAVAAIVTGPLYRAAHADDEIHYMYANLGCVDAIAMGCLAALAAHRYRLPSPTARAVRWACALALAAVYLQGIDGHEVIGFSLCALASAGYLYAAAHHPRLATSARHATVPLRWMGRHSYELYLFHIIALGLMRNVESRREMTSTLRLPWLALFLLLSCVAAAAVAHWVSSPSSQALRRRLQVRHAEDRPPALSTPHRIERR